MFFHQLLRFLSLLGPPISGSVLVQKSEKWSMEKQAKTEPNIFMRAIRGIPSNLVPGPCGPLKEFKKSANPPGLAPRGPFKEGNNQQLAAGKQHLANATQFSH